MKIQELSAWISSFAKWRSQTRPLPSEDIEWDVTVDGWKPRFKKRFVDIGAGGSVAQLSPCPAYITSKDGAVYNCALYANGINSPSTGNAIVYVMQLNFNDTIPNNTWIIVNPSAMEIVGGESVP